MTRIRTLSLATTLAVAGAALVAPPSFAKGGDGVKVQGACTKSSTAKLKLSREDSGTEIEFEVDQNRSGVPWRVTLRRSGAVIASATVTTRGPSGSFEFRKLRSGAGSVTAIATRAGERCSASASL